MAAHSIVAHIAMGAVQARLLETQGTVTAGKCLEGVAPGEVINSGCKAAAFAAVRAKIPAQSCPHRIACPTVSDTPPAAAAAATTAAAHHHARCQHSRPHAPHHGCCCEHAAAQVVGGAGHDGSNEEQRGHHARLRAKVQHPAAQRVLAARDCPAVLRDVQAATGG
jgi:hypothetical protein